VVLAVLNCRELKLVRRDTYEVFLFWSCKLVVSSCSYILLQVALMFEAIREYPRVLHIPMVLAKVSS